MEQPMMRIQWRARHWVWLGLVALVAVVLHVDRWWPERNLQPIADRQTGPHTPTATGRPAAPRVEVVVDSLGLDAARLVGPFGVGEPSAVIREDRLELAVLRGPEHLRVPLAGITLAGLSESDRARALAAVDQWLQARSEVWLLPTQDSSPTPNLEPALDSHQVQAAFVARSIARHPTEPAADGRSAAPRFEWLNLHLVREGLAHFDAATADGDSEATQPLAMMMLTRALEARAQRSGIHRPAE